MLDIIKHYLSNEDYFISLYKNYVYFYKYIDIIKFTDINTSNGIIGIIDSIVRIKHDKRTPKSPVECINCTMLFTNSSII